MINWLNIKQAADDLWSPVTPEEADVLQRVRRSNDALRKYLENFKEGELYNAHTPSYLEPEDEEAYNPSFELSYDNGDIYMGGNKLKVDKNPKDYWKGLSYENGNPVYKRSVKNDKGEYVEDSRTPSIDIKIDTLDPNGNVIHSGGLSDHKKWKYVSKVTSKAFDILQKRYRKGLTQKDNIKNIDPNGLLTYNGVPFGGIKGTNEGIDELNLINLRAGKQYMDKHKVKQAADYNTWYNSNSPRITPNLDEVAYLIHHPDFMKQHIDNVRKDLKSFRLRDSQNGPFASRYSKPLSLRQRAKQDELANNYDSKFAKRDEKEINKYSARLQKAISKFKDKYGATSRHPYQGDGVPVSRRHSDTSIYFFPF